MARAKRQRGRGEDRIDPGHIQKLLERANAEDDYITRAQLVRFLDHPNGPILPEACVEMRRLPTDFGTHGAGWVAGPSDPIKDLSVRPTDGALCIATVRRGTNIVVCGVDKYKLFTDLPGCQSNVRILGFHPTSRLPITHLQMFSYSGPNRCVSEGPGRIFVGGEFTLEMPHAQAETVVLVANGDVLWLQGAPELWSQGVSKSRRPERWRVRRNSAIIVECTEHLYHKFVELPDGRILGTRDQGDLGIAPEPYPVADCVGPIDNEQRVFMNGIHDVVITRGMVMCIRDDIGARCAFNISVVCGIQTKVDRSHDVAHLGPVRYVSSYTELPDGRAAYIGEIKHNELPCWVVAGEEQISFEHVSPLFLDGDRWCYWGALGRRLYKMEIPPV